LDITDRDEPQIAARFTKALNPYNNLNATALLCMGVDRWLRGVNNFSYIFIRQRVNFMNTSRMGMVAFAILVASMVTPFQNSPALAVEAYSSTEEKQFMDWCTGAKSATESTCSCTVKRLAQTVPAAALTQFLTSQGSFNMSTAAVTTGAAVTQALVSCSNG